MQTLLILLFPIFSSAQVAGDCPPAVLQAELAKLSEIVEKDFCILQKISSTDEAALKELVAQHKGGPVVGTYAVPTSRTASTVTFKISPEKVLNPGENMYFGVPVDIAARPVRFAILGHRQDPSREKGWDAARKWDDKPGITAMQFHSVKPGEGWRYWQGPSSGRLGGKFAEIRNDPELENLYDFQKFGHTSVETNSTTTSNLLADGIRLTNTGVDEVLVSEVTLKVLPPKPSRYLTGTFSPGTEIGEYETMKGQTFGGGQGGSFMGKFPGALEMGRGGSGGEGAAKLPSGWRINKGKLHIPLPAGVNVASIEVAIGDTKPDGARNKDGGWGSLGWARLNARVQRADGSSDVLINNENIPPEGVLSGSPLDSCYSTRSGDEVVVDIQRDTAYIMGLRVGIRDAK